MQMREVKLPSGAVLKVGTAPFAVSKALYQAVLKEARTIEIHSKMEMSNLYKEIFCAGLSTPEIDRCLLECFQRCTYNSGSGDRKIDDDTFEPVASRDDYISVCVEVARDNIGPFMKSLYAEYLRMSAMIENIRA